MTEEHIKRIQAAEEEAAAIIARARARAHTIYEDAVSAAAADYEKAVKAGEAAAHTSVEQFRQKAEKAAEKMLFENRAVCLEIDSAGRGKLAEASELIIKSVTPLKA